jgi:hypothetical protein
MHVRVYSLPSKMSRLLTVSLVMRLGYEAPERNGDDASVTSQKWQ